MAGTVLETYLGRDAGHRVLRGEIARGSAESIRAVIWFADLRGFTKLTDTLPREQVTATLDDYLEAMAAPVQARGGQVLKFMGDGLLATFDLTGHDEAAVCAEALAAASELRASFPSFNEARAVEGKPVMDFGLALHLGEVLYGNIGASDRLDFTVIGPAVNEASRIQALCPTPGAQHPGLREFPGRRPALPPGWSPSAVTSCAAYASRRNSSASQADAWRGAARAFSPRQPFSRSSDRSHGHL